jgi:hypothetical protein
MGKSARRSARRFLPCRKSPHDFFAGLNAARCRYVVLRWFDTLPHVEAGEDIDILVHDEDVEKVRALLTPRPLSARLLGRKDLIRCDVYSVSGLPGSSYRGIAYYPPHLAQGMLERAVRHSSGAMVPSARDHFHSLTFHALYHKGLRSGLPVSSPDLQSNPAPEHDYARALQSLADEVGLTVDIEMNALDNEFARAGWRPSIDFMERVLPDDPWIRSRVAAVWSDRPVVDGLAVFIVRERALERPGAVEAIADLLREDGFNVLAINQISEACQLRCEREIRGGNWGRGPWPISGGGPAVALAVLDVFPIPPAIRLKERHPRADNQRVFTSKDRIRDWSNENLPAAQKCNVVHSSDNAMEAMSHLDLLFAETRDSILDAAARLSAAADAPGEVVRRLDRSGRRAIVELIRRADGSLAVRKRFRPGKEEFFQRELSALTTLGRLFPDVVPTILETGRNFVVIPYYADARARLGTRLGLPMPVRTLRKAFLSAKAFFDRGIVLGDFRPHNLIVESGHRIKIVDYEDAYERSPDAPPPHLGGLEILSPDEFDMYWGRAAGLSLHSLMNDPLWLLYLKRWTFGYPSSAIAALRKVNRNLAKHIDRRRQRMALRHARRLANASRQAQAVADDIPPSIAGTMPSPAKGP